MEKSRFSPLVREYKASQFKTSLDNRDYLGKGSFGAVRACYDTDSKKVAVKCSTLAGSGEALEKRVKNVVREVNVLIHVSHSHIVQIMGYTTWSNSIGIILEFVNGGNLDDLLHSDKVSQLAWCVRAKWMHQLTEALSYLHNYEKDKFFCHGDLKPDNVMLTRELSIKLADFGSASLIKATGVLTTSEIPASRQYTFTYAAPEFLRHPLSKHTQAMDMYSYAMILYEIITRKQVYSGFRGSYSLLRELIVDGTARPNLDLVNEIKKDIGHDNKELSIFECLKTVMEKCSKSASSERLTSGEVAEVLFKILKPFSDNIDSEISSIAEQYFRKAPITQSTENQELSKLSHPFFNISLPFFYISASEDPTRENNPIHIPASTPPKILDETFIGELASNDFEIAGIFDEFEDINSMVQHLGEGSNRFELETRCKSLLSKLAAIEVLDYHPLAVSHCLQLHENLLGAAQAGIALLVFEQAIGLIQSMDGSQRKLQCILDCIHHCAHNKWNNRVAARMHLLRCDELTQLMTAMPNIDVSSLLSHRSRALQDLARFCFISDQFDSTIIRAGEGIELAPNAFCDDVERYRYLRSMFCLMRNASVGQRRWNDVDLYDKKIFELKLQFSHLEESAQFNLHNVAQDFADKEDQSLG